MVQEGYLFKFKNMPQNLYRYRKDDPYHIENLFNNKDWFSYPCDFNDPFDTCLTLSKNQYYNDLLRLKDSKKDPSLAGVSNRELKTLVQDTYPDAVTSLNKKFRSETFQICCYSEQLFSIPMWTHYSGNHSGYCVAYSDFNAIESHDLFPVIYSSSSVNARSQFFNKDKSKNDFGALLAILHKYKDWSYEREWRLIKRIDNKPALPANPRTVKTPTAIYMGVNSSSKLESNLKLLSKEKDLPLFKMEADYYKIGLKPTQISG